ncbi:PTS fructose transporter subunit IIA [uncultured Streptococcus sp.]|uniref:PTS sugar transporter subunit IIA n=1 Tax=uncultured Streptococcus sp. TaxID=83427 RepID=UPI0028E7856B|nr:PTS fructose transporter subunit IIA [uncultured Streptococcus sp.]
MKYLVLVSHGGLAEGLKSSLAMFAGDKIDQVIAVGLKEGKSVDDFAYDFRQALAPLADEDSVLVLADIVGGSPLTTAATVLEEQGKLSTALILGGMNLTMALTAVVMKDMMEGADLAQVILSEASTALQEFALTPVEGDDEEDDDI